MTQNFFLFLFLLCVTFFSLQPNSDHFRVFFSIISFRLNSSIQMQEQREGFLKLFHFLCSSRDQLAFVVDQNGSLPASSRKTSRTSGCPTLTVLSVPMPSGFHTVTQWLPQKPFLCSACSLANSSSGELPRNAACLLASQSVQTPYSAEGWALPLSCQVGVSQIHSDLDHEYFKVTYCPALPVSSCHASALVSGFPARPSKTLWKPLVDD